MQYHSKINFFKTPVIWVKDKLYVGFNQPNMVLLAAIPGVFGLVGLIANVKTILNAQDLNLTLLWFLFIYGLLISLLIISHQRTILRLKRDRKTFEIIHKEIAEGLRKYLAKKRNQSLTESQIEDFIRDILNSFNKSFMRVIHRSSVVVTVKYLVEGKLYPIRAGDTDNRFSEPEPSAECAVYNLINKTGKKKSYLYVKNINKLDKFETQTIGEAIEDIKRRSINKYLTFIALPIRAGELRKTGKFTARKELGLIGFDLNEKYGFGNFDKHEFDILATLADLLSEPVNDIIELKTSNNNDNN